MDIFTSGNTHNRPFQQGTAEKYLADPQSGAWQELTHQGIAFDKTKRLVDGQHRLWAIAQFGKTVLICVWYNLPISAQQVIDTATQIAGAAGVRNRGKVREFLNKLVEEGVIVMTSPGGGRVPASFAFVERGNGQVRSVVGVSR